MKFHDFWKIRAPTFGNLVPGQQLFPLFVYLHDDHIYKNNQEKWTSRSSKNIIMMGRRNFPRRREKAAEWFLRLLILRARFLRLVVEYIPYIYEEHGAFSSIFSFFPSDYLPATCTRTHWWYATLFVTTKQNSHDFHYHLSVTAVGNTSHPTIIH